MLVIKEYQNMWICANFGRIAATALRMIIYLYYSKKYVDYNNKTAGKLRLR